ncbi:helix-turn-helix transcriptional regulator [Shinella pollutisoli]|uniref:Helix-turn-helix transcriptional regulator n=1 Tax=Shinella pollutisoli TaxID=2250594 RepID=A0ABV7DKK7_9HYPH|nr:AraC family transcriptional regulator [Shinella pollutisoli]
MSIVQFSTRDTAENLRRELVEAVYNGHVRTGIDFLGDGPVDIDVTLRGVGGVHIAHANTTPVTLVTPSDEEDLLYLSVAGGNGVHDAKGENLFIRPGDVNVMRRDRKTVTTVAERSSCLSIAIPRRLVVDRIASSDNLLKTWSLRDPAAHLLNSYAVSLLDSHADIPAPDQAVFAAHLVDLTVLMLGAKRDSGQHARRNGVRAARRHAIKADIAAHLCDPRLSLEWLARRHGISVPYVRALFYEEGTSFTDHVTAERLDHAHGLLLDPRFRHHTIAAIALMVGFGDISWFNQVFRRRFQATPSDIRQGLALN